MKRPLPAPGICEALTSAGGKTYVTSWEQLALVVPRVPFDFEATLSRSAFSAVTAKLVTRARAALGGKFRSADANSSCDGERPSRERVARSNQRRQTILLLQSGQWKRSGFKKGKEDQVFFWGVEARARRVSRPRDYYTTTCDAVGGWSLAPLVLEAGCRWVRRVSPAPAGSLTARLHKIGI